MEYPNKPVSSEGKLIVVTGPSGVGKGTLLQILADRHPGRVLFSVSVTTRRPRPGETNGREYFFWTRRQFEEHREKGGFLEWAEYAGNLYGTPRQAVEDWIDVGQMVILEIELKGARQVAETYPHALRIFIAPPSMAILESRLLGRGVEDEAAIAKRLDHAREEVAAAAEFDLTIINDDLETALKQLEKAVFS